MAETKKREIKEEVKEQPKPEIVALVKNNVTVYRAYADIEKYLSMGWKEVK